MREIRSPLDGIPSPFAARVSAAAFSPASLFASGEDGAWYDPSDTTSLYQSRTGGDYADADGDVVGIMLDKSQMGGSTAADFIAAQPELVTNGTFDTDSDWTLTGASISGGVANFGAFGHELYQQPGFDETKHHAVTFTVTGSGSLYFRLGAIAASVEQVTTSGTYTFVVKPTSNAGYIVFRSFGFTGTLDNVSVKEIPGNHAVAPSDAARPLYKTDGTYHWLLPDATDDSMDFASAGMSVNSVVAYAVDAGASNVYLVFSREDAGNYIDLAANGSASACDNITGSPQKRLDGIPISLTTRDQVHDAFAGAPHVYLVSALDLSVWNNVTLFDYYTGGFPFGGKFFGCVSVDRDLTTNERDNLEAYLAAKSGVTL